MSLKHNSESHYSAEEKNDMIRCYEESGRNIRRAREDYAELCPKRQREVFLQMTRRARTRRNDREAVDITTDHETDDEDKEKVKLCNALVDTIPIVYTTRLDQMSIFRRDVSYIKPKTIVREILIQSKPKLEEPRTINCNEHYVSYDEMVRKLDNVFKKKPVGSGNVIVIDEEDSDDDLPLMHLKLDDKNENLDFYSIDVKKYRSVFLSFSCTNKDATDLYYIDNKGFVTLHNRINDKFDTSEYVGSTEILMFSYCCWYKRRELTLALNKLPKETLEFVRDRHICILSSCTCCCSPQKISAVKGLNSTETLRNTDDCYVIDDKTPITDDPIDLESVDDELEYVISKFTEDVTNSIQIPNNQNFTVENRNKWLREIISTINSSMQPMSNNSLVTVMLNFSKFNRKLSSNLLKHNVICRRDPHLVIHLSSNELNEIYEINEGILISRATTVNKDYLSREVFKRNRSLINTFTLADDIISLASRESNERKMVSTVSVPCCWYFREALINSRYGAYDFMRQPHTCALGHCKCCCKKLRLAEYNKKIHLYVKDKSFDLLLNDFEPINDLVQFRYIREAWKKMKSKVIEPSIVSSHSNISRIQVSSKTTKNKNKFTAPVKHLGSQFSLLNDEIQSIEIDDCVDDDNPSAPNTGVPGDSRTSLDSHNIVIHSHFQRPEEENPSSDITLFNPEMACTIKTYAVDSVETSNELDGSDPLEGTYDIKDYNVDSVTKYENEDDDEIGSNDVDPDPPIYANVEKDIADDPLAVDDTLIEIKDEDKPCEAPTNVSVDGTRSSATTEKVLHESVDVEHLVSSIKDRFPKVKLFVNENRHVTADIGVCVTTLSTGELSILANILTKAQEQVDSLDLVPGTILSGDISVIGNNYTYKFYSFKVPESNVEMGLPRIENVCSLKDTQDKHKEAPRIRVRPLQELGVTETNTMGMAKTNVDQVNKTLETPKPMSWLQKALTSEMKPMTNPYPVITRADASTSTYDSRTVPSFVIPERRHQSQTTQTPAKPCPRKNKNKPKESECRKSRKRKKESANLLGDDISIDLESRSHVKRRNPTARNQRQKPLSAAPATVTSATSKSSGIPSSNIPVVICLDSDDD